MEKSEATPHEVAPEIDAGRQDLRNHIKNDSHGRSGTRPFRGLLVDTRSDLDSPWLLGQFPQAEVGFWDLVDRIPTYPLGGCAHVVRGIGVVCRRHPEDGVRCRDCADEHAVGCSRSSRRRCSECGDDCLNPALAGVAPIFDRSLRRVIKHALIVDGWVFCDSCSRVGSAQS